MSIRRYRRNPTKESRGALVRAMILDDEKRAGFDWVAANCERLSQWLATIWDFHEPAWREYRSAAW